MFISKDALHFVRKIVQMQKRARVRTFDHVEKQVKLVCIRETYPWGGYLGQVFTGYVPLVPQNPYLII